MIIPQTYIILKALPVAQAHPKVITVSKVDENR
jgi:hypothetical protein